MKPEEFVARLKERASAILRTNDAAVARKAMDAAIRGGFRIKVALPPAPLRCVLSAGVDQPIICRISFHARITLAPSTPVGRPFCLNKIGRMAFAA